jgi:hypothetical protein
MHYSLPNKTYILTYFTTLSYLFHTYDDGICIITSLVFSFLADNSVSWK